MRFGAVFALITFISLVSQETVGDWGFIIAAAAGGIVSAGAIVATAAGSFTLGIIPITTAVYAVIVATTASVLNKLLYVYASDRKTKLTKIVAKDSMVMAAGVVIYIILLVTGFIPFV